MKWPVVRSRRGERRSGWVRVGGGEKRRERREKNKKNKNKNKSNNLQNNEN